MDQQLVLVIQIATATHDCLALTLREKYCACIQAVHVEELRDRNFQRTSNFAQSSYRRRDDAILDFRKQSFAQARRVAYLLQRHTPSRTQVSDATRNFMLDD